MSIEQLPESPSDPEPDVPVPDLHFYYSPFGFFYVMLLTAWCAFRHPFSTSVIDLETGTAHHYYNGEEIV
jgi:hypothetical protein